MEKVNVKEQSRKNVLEQLKIDEGVEYKIYNDHLGYPTLGIGHLIQRHDEEYGMPIGTPVSEEVVEKYFYVDLQTAISECCQLYSRVIFETFPDEVQEILVNMMFNMGRTRLSKFKKMNSALTHGNWKEAAKEGRDSRWYNQVTNRAERLMSRLENVWPNTPTVRIP
jgi:lysozyme